MGMIIQHNMASMNANRNLGVVSGQLSKSTEKLSSGYRINRAGDDAAGLAISEKMRGQIRGLNQASSNAEDGISLIQTAEGALTETHSILQRMRELAVQAASDTNTADDRTQIQTEIDQLTEEVDRIANTTEFNTKKLIDGSRTGAVSEKAGKANVEGTFSNSNVSASITQDGSAKQAYTDVIRVEVKSDFTDYGKDNGKLAATPAKVDAYKALATDIATITSQIDKFQTTGATFGGAVTDAEITAYMDATKKVLQGDSTAYNDQTDAWKAIAAHITGTAAAGEAMDLGSGAITAGDNAAAIQSTVKNALDELVNKQIEMETNEDYVAFGKITVDDVSTPAVDTKKLSDIMNDLSAKDATYKTTTTDATLAGYGLTTTGVDTLADAYKDALKAAYKNGAADPQKEEDVVNARKALYEKFDADLKNTTATGAAVNVTKGDGTTEAFTAAQQKQEVAGAALDAIMLAADRLAQEELNQENAIAKIDTSGVAPDKAFDVKDLFSNGGDADKFEVASTLDGNNNLKITLKNTDGVDTEITIKNADKLKAGDVITISSEEYTPTKEAATGKDALRLQAGANAGQEVTLGINSMKAKDLNIVQTKDGHEGAALNVTEQADASLAVNAYDMAIQKVSAERAKMGAVQNRLEHTISNLDTSSENLQSAESRIRDTDMAEEMTQYSKSNILMQAGQSMLAQANQSTQGVLSLLQ